MMYWHIGERINSDVLGNERAAYGKQIVATVARQLQTWCGGKGFEERTIRIMVQFAQEFPDWQIVSPLVSKLSWTHFLTIMTLKDLLVQQIQKSIEVASPEPAKPLNDAQMCGSFFSTSIVNFSNPTLRVSLREKTLCPQKVFPPCPLLSVFISKSHYLSLRNKYVVRLKIKKVKK